jgi:hypothetical protein
MILKTTEFRSFYTSSPFSLGGTELRLDSENPGQLNLLTLKSMSSSETFRFFQASDQKDLIFSENSEKIFSEVFHEYGGEEGFGCGQTTGNTEGRAEEVQAQESYLVLN